MHQFQPCPGCGFDTDSVSSTDAATLIRHTVKELTGLLATSSTGQVLPPPGNRTWNAVEYAGHVRDVLVIQRERILRTLFENEPTARPMRQDDRVEIGEYREWSLQDLALEVKSAGRWLAHTVERIEGAAWHRRMIYNHPSSASRSLLWVTAHTIHEVVHHTQDIREGLQPIAVDWPDE